MTYYERLKDASYTSPSGQIIEFDYEVLSREVTHRIGSFEFAGVNGTLHQDKGVSGEIYPLKIFIHGQDYDQDADRFLTISKETGPGFLDHPRWGRKRVQILSITQSENLSTQGGQATFDVQFQETLEREFPKTSASAQQSAKIEADIFEETATENFAEQILGPLGEIKEAAVKVALEQDMIGSANLVNDALGSIASAVDSVSTTFNNGINDIINNAAEYVDTPIKYAEKIVSSIRVVTNIPGKISSKVQGYKKIIDTIKIKNIGTSITQVKNSLLIDELVGTTSMVAASESINDALSQASTISRRLS